MNFAALSPAVKAVTGLAVGAAFAGAVALTATHGGHPGKSSLNAGTIDVTPTAFVEKAGTPVYDKPPPTFAPPPIPVRTVIPGADRGGLFADGIPALAPVDTSAWETYSNRNYGYSFKYPADWLLHESDSAGFKGPNSEPAYPLNSASVQNPDQGRKIPGQNCTAAANDCGGALPMSMYFGV